MNNITFSQDYNFRVIEFVRVCVYSVKFENSKKRESFILHDGLERFFDEKCQLYHWYKDEIEAIKSKVKNVST